MSKIRIALIDTGLSDEYCKRKNLEVKHFYVSSNKVIEGCQESIDQHARYCIEMILNNDNPEFEFFDICIMDKLEKSLILGIKKAISENADIINLSLGCNTYSPELFKACEEAIDNNIVIIAAASHDGEVFYPAYLKNVVCVKVSNHQSEIIEKVDDSTISISDKLPVTTDNQPLSTSLAAAYFTGEVGRALNNKPFYNKFKILKNNFNLNIKNTYSDITQSNYKEMDLNVILKKHKAAVVLDPFEDIEHFNADFMHKNIVAYYDHELQIFKNFSNHQKSDMEFEYIFILNTLAHNQQMEIPLNIKARFLQHKMVFLGNFKHFEDETNLIYKHEDWNDNSLVNLTKPIIMIIGLGCNFNKFDVSLTLFDMLQHHNIKTNVITYDKKGILYGWNVFKYPDKIIFPDIVGSINNYINLAETNKDFDMWIIDVGGGSFFFNNKNRNNFGKLNEAYFHAINVDILLICIDGYVNYNDLDLYIKRVQSLGIDNIYYILSENAIDPLSWDGKEGIQNYKLDKQKYTECFKKLKTKYKENIFSMDDVRGGILYDNIMKLFNC